MAIEELCLGSARKWADATRIQPLTKSLAFPWLKPEPPAGRVTEEANPPRARANHQKLYFQSYFAVLAGFLALWLGTSAGLGESPVRQMLKVSKQREGDTIRFFVENVERAEVTGTFELGLVNMKGSTHFPFTATFAPRQKVEAFSLSILRKESDWSYTLTNYYTVGNHGAVHDDTVIYQLPYQSGHAYRVSQGYHGTFSHQGAECYSIDWQMPPETPVLAARAGMIAAVKDDSNQGGEDRQLESCANYVLIQHEDGTMANYAHLRCRGVRVQLGDWVESGTLIGYSGNTGFSSGPHLHFCVFKTRNGKERISLPVKFRTENQGITQLQSGATYRAPKTLLASTKVATGRVANRPEY